MNSGPIENRYQGRSGVQIDMRPFRLMTSSERVTVEEFVTRESGLRRNQFASNSWGFPFIPFPYPRSGFEGRMRIAPGNVSDLWLGHPIFWIDPRLTHFDPDIEPESWWCIRMFFLIQSFGLWNESYQWVNMAAGIDHDAIDVQNFHQATSPSCAFDAIEMLVEDDMSIGLEECNRMYGEAIGNCSQSLVDENEALIQRQTNAYNTAQDILKSDIQKGKITAFRADNHGSMWSTNVYPNLVQVMDLYEARIRANPTSAKLSDLVPNISTYFEYAENVIKTMNKVSSILTIPVLKKVNPDPDAFSLLASYIGTAIDDVTSRNQNYGFQKKALMTTSSDIRLEALREVIDEVWKEYQLAWKRVLMAASNFERVQNDQEPFTSFSALEVHHNTKLAASEKTSDSDIIRSLDKFVEGL